MPTIAQGIAANEARLAKGAAVVAPRQQSLEFFPPTPGASQGLPVRGVLSPNLVIGTDFYAGAMQFRFGQRSSSPPPALAVSKTSTPQSLLNKRLISPVIGGGAKLNRYNTVVTTISPVLVANGAQSSQTFVVAGVQAADTIIGYQWKTAQAKGVVVLAVRVTGSNSITIDFFNPTAGSLTPTGGPISLFLVQ